MATSCKMFEPKPHEEAVKTLNVEDRYLTQEEMTELVSYVYAHGEKSVEEGRYNISTYEITMEEDGEMLVKAALVFVYEIQETFYFADDTTTSSPFFMLVVMNRPQETQHKDDDGNIIAVQWDVDYEFYGSFYNEYNDAYSVKPNKMFKKRITFEGISGGVISNKVTESREDSEEGHDSDDWKVWMSMFYERMQVDKNTVKENETP